MWPTLPCRNVTARAKPLQQGPFLGDSASASVLVFAAETPATSAHAPSPSVGYHAPETGQRGHLRRTAPPLSVLPVLPTQNPHERESFPELRSGLRMDSIFPPLSRHLCGRQRATGVGADAPTLTSSLSQARPTSLQGPTSTPEQNKAHGLA